MGDYIRHLAPSSKAFASKETRRLLIFTIFYVSQAFLDFLLEKPLFQKALISKWQLMTTWTLMRALDVKMTENCSPAVYPKMPKKLKSKNISVNSVKLKQLH